jgi:DNA repair protein RecO
MNRLIKENYIPLKSSDMGENHKLVLILSAGQGLIRIAVFGVKGKKSGAQRALIQPYSLCRGDLYYDPVKKLWRLKEGECLESRDSFHTHLNKYYAALFWSDLIIQTYAGGGSQDFFNMSENLFRNLSNAEGAMVPGIFLRSLWDYLALEGIQPETNRCSRCGRLKQSVIPAKEWLSAPAAASTVCLCSQLLPESSWKP